MNSVGGYLSLLANDLRLLVTARDVRPLSSGPISRLFFVRSPRYWKFIVVPVL